MKFQFFVLLTSALALPALFSRDAQVSSTQCLANIQTSAWAIGNGTLSVGNTAANVYYNKILTMLSLQAKTSDLIKTIQNAGKQVNSSCPTLTLNEALPLVNVLGALQQPIQETMNVLTTKKGTFDHAILYAFSLSWLVKCDLDQVIDATQGLSYAIRGKVPTAAAGIVDNLSGQLLAPIIKTRDLYADNNGPINLNAKTKL